MAKGKITVNRPLITGVDFNPYNPGQRIFNTSSNYQDVYFGRKWKKITSMTDPSHRALTLRQILDRQTQGLPVDINKSMGFSDVDFSHLDNMSLVDKLEYSKQLAAQTTLLNQQLHEQKTAAEKKRLADLNEAELKRRTDEFIANYKPDGEDKS